ncbi:MAG: RNA polymerase sigma factor [Cyclobacteriaceae bacterium]
MKFFQSPFRQLPDEALMEQVSKGSERAVEVLYHRYSSPLLRYFYRMLWQDREKAEDFLHDLFVKLLDSRESYDNQRKFSTWLYSIAYNMCKNEYRRQAFRKSIQPDPLNLVLRERVTQQMDQSSFQKALETMLQSEEEDVRSMFVMRYHLEMTISEIGDVLKCPEGTVKSRLFYLKKRLANQLFEFKLMIEE